MTPGSKHASGYRPGLTKAMQREDYERAVDLPGYTPDGETRRAARPRAAPRSRRGAVDRYDHAQRNPEGNLQDNLPDNLELVGTVKTKRGEYKILLERVRKENNPPVWLFSSETLKFVPQIYDEIDVPWLERHLPAALTETRWPATAVPVDHTPRGASPGAFSRLAIHEGSLPWFASRCQTVRRRGDASSSGGSETP